MMDAIVSPTGQMIPGGLAALGIGNIPVSVPQVPPEPTPPPPPPAPDVTLPAATLPPGPASGMPPGMESLARGGLPAPVPPPPAPLGPLSTSPELLSFLQGRKPPQEQDQAAGPAPAPALGDAAPAAPAI